MPTQQELFLELAQPNENGISRWVNTSEFVGRYSTLELLNGLSWGRKSSTLAKKYNVETDKSVTTGNKIDRIRLNGFNTCHTSTHTQSIRNDIKQEISKQRCVILGTNRSCDHKTEVDHKDGRKDDPRVMNTKTQTLEDFQPLSKPANDAKRQFCKECKESNLRYDAKLLGYPVSFTKGDINYTPELKCIGCFWYDPIAFRQALKLKYS
ncbi:restriction endonuclease [Aliarcobacter butzleri]|uniref:restriction endonuclease n=1 Tax=Aliarcobacter butzleri TaxID=28197 RepID=UPI00102DAA64|nr:restriction endonuclease [Aliarcobacter butzleri]MCP3648720.1 restriction endonuclease [Arcobacter sp. DNRA7]MCR1814893.1 restriction endonuclease [Aliarcobacter butzleri]RZV19931.1 restriction endonuclease [Aliarcobacter butzleri]